MKRGGKPVKWFLSFFIVHCLVVGDWGTVAFIPNLVHSFTSDFELLLTRGIRLFNKNKALRIFLGLKMSLTQCDFCPVL